MKQTLSTSISKMTMKLSWGEYQKIKDIKQLDLQLWNQLSRISLMIGLVVIYVVKNWNQPVRKEWLRIGIILVFGGWVVVIRYFVWCVWGGSFMGGWVVVRKRLGGSIWGGGMFNYSW